MRNAQKNTHLGLSFEFGVKMTPEQFAYWLQGFSEINGQAPTVEQWQVIQDHLKLVFEKMTPERQLIGTNFKPYEFPHPLDLDAFRRMNPHLTPSEGPLTITC